MKTTDQSHRGRRRTSRQPPFSTLLKRLESYCADQTDFKRAFARGATDNQINDFARRFGQTLPSAFLKFYGWRNGSRARNVYGYYRLLSLREITHHKRLMDGMENEAFFESRKASSIRRSLYPDHPIRRRARTARRPRHTRPKLTLERHNLERGPYNWCIDCAGALVEISYGRGYSRTVKRREFATTDAAQRFVEREVAKKKKAGYQTASSFESTADDDFLRDASRHLRKLNRQ